MNTSILKRGALAIGSAALLLSTTVGLTSAQTAPTTPAATTTTSTGARQQRQAIFSLAATKLGLTSDQLTQALQSARKDLGVNKANHPQAGKLGRAELTVAATTLGYPDLKSMHKDLKGTTLTALAATHNVPATTVSAAMKADVATKIQALVTAGTLKTDAATKLTTKVDARIDALMTHQFK